MLLPRLILLMMGLVLAASPRCLAQPDRDLFHVRHNVSPIRLDGNRDVLQGVDVGVRVPVRHDSTQTLLAGIHYEGLLTGLRGPSLSQAAHGLATSVTWIYRLQPHQTLLVSATAGLFSDLKDIAWEDFRYTLAVRHKTRIHDRFQLAYGLGISHQFSGLVVVPFVDFDWRITSRWRLSGPVPVNTQLHYRVTPRTTCFLLVKPENSTYRLSATEHQSRYLQRRQWNGGAGMAWMMTRHWQLTFTGGYTLRRNFALYDPAQRGALTVLTFDLRGRAREPVTTDQQKSWFVEVSLAWLITNP